jgi:dATP/dGTP diphosphohydrolase, N-terminal
VPRIKRVCLKSKALTPNSKELLGMKKVSISKLPMVAVMHGAHAMMNGAAKYGKYNWRDKRVIASIYVDALFRHVMGWFEGEETAKDSGVHHLGHAIACAAILLDALETGSLIDDRPVVGKGDLAARVLERLAGIIQKSGCEGMRREGHRRRNKLQTPSLSPVPHHQTEGRTRK